jgi:glycosyltransferase involved in cell wall biosynthesis
MRIAYIAPYQGPELIRRRPTVINRSLAGTTKIELIARLLQDSGHELEIISQGEVVELAAKFYPAFEESELFDPQIPVRYSSALPVRFLNGSWSSWFTLRYFLQRHRAKPFDLVLLYNLKCPQRACANHARRRLRLPVVLEYEDDVFVDLGGQDETGFRSGQRQKAYREVIANISGGIAVSPRLQSQFPAGVPSLLLRGLVGEDIVVARDAGARMNWALFSGTHTKAKGVAQLIQAWQLARLDGWQLHITGTGDQTDELKGMAGAVPGVVFHGMVDRPKLVELICRSKVCVNPHDLSEQPGNVFAFKLVEYLAGGAHVISTPMGPLESGLERGITYIPDNRPLPICEALKQVCLSDKWRQCADEKALDAYRPATVARALDALLSQVLATDKGRIR